MPVKLLTPSSPASFDDNVSSLLVPALTDTDPLYILLKRYDTVPKFIAVSYVPDTAKVRQKMLFASTRLTLVRELGREHFRETIFATAKEELTPAGFARHDKHEQLEAPLTEGERSLQGVKDAEAQEGSRGTGTREMHMGQKMSMAVHEDALASLKELGSEGGKNLVMLVSAVVFPQHLGAIGSNIEAVENQPGHRKDRARARLLLPIVHIRTRPDHLRHRASIHILPFYTRA